MREIIQIIKEVEKAVGNNKIAILRHNKDNELLRKVLVYTMDKDRKYKMTKKSISLREGKSKWDNIFDMLDELAESNINNDLKINVCRFLKSIEDEDERDLYTKMLLKDLKINVGVKSVNKAMDGLIVDFAVMKASSYSDKNIEPFNRKAKKVGYMMMVKENGIRGEVFKENGKVLFKTRQNKVIPQLVELEEAFKDMPNNYFYEGELLAFNPSGEEWKTSEEEFKLTDKIISTDGEKRGLYIKLFDCIPIEHYKQGESDIRADVRKEGLKHMVDDVNNKHIKFCDIIYQGKDTDKIQEKLEEVSEGSRKEGLMVILNDSGYQAKRVKTILKCKIFHTFDLRVVDIIESKERKDTMGSAVVLYKGNRVGVSGWSDADKRKYWDNPNELIGKIIEVKFKAITVDKNGVPSLQFPNVVRVREDREDESFE